MMKAGGDSASSTSTTARQSDCRASATASTPKPSQYTVAISRNMLPEPGSSGSISAQSTVITGDCQSP